MKVTDFILDSRKAEVKRNTASATDIIPPFSKPLLPYVTATLPPPSKSFISLEKWLLRQIGKAIADYNMISAGDTVMVCVSGGKDSYTLLSCLLALRERAPVDFRIVAMNLNQRQPGFPEDVLPAWFEKTGVEYRIVSEDTYSIVKDKIPEGKTTCSLCSRLRRGIIYRTAREIGATRIALGHHRDDILETLFLNMFFGGKIKAMPPKLKSDDGQHIVIRPLAYCSEADIARYARAKAFPIIPCNLCGSQENAQRRQIKAMLQDWAKHYPGRIESLATSLKNIIPSHLGDSRLFDFAQLAPNTHTPEEKKEKAAVPIPFLPLTYRAHKPVLENQV
ncbi:MAG: tRNA 2-thiocytidine(32) synthetase TtcA [Azoarcus sp.]|jgi:tRNA 2-thiocytidine biosynthesis protein TtcA|nr:tRNA 2-thiocytidine(32) synthetase TtcA [Azoarcus sp.]